MKETIEDIRAKLVNDKYKSKEHIRLSLVGRILHESGWDLWNPDEVYPEFPVDPSGNKPIADLALFAEPASPSVFLEITAPGEMETNINEYESRLPDYSIEDTVLLIIITDGRHWKFYYSHSAESFSNMCFKTLDMLEDSVDKLESAFETYLLKNNIADGAAQRDARDYLWLSTVVEAVEEILPQARLQVNEPPYPRLPQAVVKLVIEKGLEITEDDVVKILDNIETAKIPESSPSTSKISEPLQAPESQPATEPPESEPPAPESEPTTPEQEPEPEQPSEPEPPPVPESSSAQTAVEKPPAGKPKQQNYLNKKIKSFVFLGNTYSPKSWKEMLITFCEIIYSMHSSEFYKCMKLRINDQLCFSKNIKDFFGHSPVQIDNTEFCLMTDLNSNEIVDLVYKILELFYYDNKDIEINAR